MRPIPIQPSECFANFFSLDLTCRSAEDAARVKMSSDHNVRISSWRMMIVAGKMREVG
jgi:hypothetical protein